MAMVMGKRFAQSTLALGLLCTIGYEQGQALAQIPTVSSDGTLANPSAAPPPPPPPAPAAPVVIPLDASGKPIAPAAETDTGFYYNDDVDGTVSLGGEPVPATHTIEKGDTLWDISSTYFNNPWEWPRVWSYNPEITNPHWIYPGGTVRLYAAGTEPSQSGTFVKPENTLARPDEIPPEKGKPNWFSMRQLAFVDRQNLAFAGTIVGSTDEKRLLSDGDNIYIDYPKGQPPKVGKKYSVYAETKSVKHPNTGANVGSYVTIIGEIEIRSVKQGKRARALVTDTIEPLERGHRVGPVERTFKNLEPRANETDLQATVVGQFSRDALIGARQVIFLDKGKRDGLRNGNTLFVVRRGDALPEMGGKPHNAGQNDEDYPARAIGEIMIAQAGEHTSVGLVTISVREIEIGDMVLMRKGNGGSE
jgi:hypothetical protein